MARAEESAEVLARKERLTAREAELSKGDYFKKMEAFDEAGTTTLTKVLVDAGFELTPPDQLTDEQLTEKLWALIRRMADFRCFLSQTDHLSDRELYTHLLEVTLPEEMNATVAKPDPDSAWHIDLIGGGSDEDVQIMLRYYSTEEDREEWQDDFPDDVIPPMSIPPYDRDQLLPKWNE